MNEQIDQEIRDRYLIEQVLRQYCRGVDRGDVELIKDVYWEDAYDDHGTFKGSGWDFAELVVEAINSRMLATMHNMHQVNIRFDGDKAYVESYLTAHHRRVEDGATVLDFFGGRYCDRFEKRGGEWRIAHRVVVNEWSKIEKPEQEYPTEPFEKGKRSVDDLSYVDL